MGYPPSSAMGSSQRRSQRILAQVPIVIRGAGNPEPAFQEETRTLVINAHGALVLLATKVTQGQKLFVKHKRTQEEQECRVVYMGPAEGGKTQVGMEFAVPNPGFWHVSFPPTDWTPHHEDAKVRPH